MAVPIANCGNWANFKDRLVRLDFEICRNCAIDKIAIEIPYERETEILKKCRQKMRWQSLAITATR